MKSSELKLLHAGNENLFGILIASVEPALRCQIRRYVGADHDVGDDLFQEVSIKVFGRLKDYRADGPFGAWCYRVCARVCLDYVRRTARIQRAMPSVDGEFDSAADSRSESDRVRSANAFDARMEAVTDAVVALAPRKRLIATLHWYSGWTAAHIARELSLRPSSVWTTLSEIRATLRLVLAPYARVPSITPI